MKKEKSWHHYEDKNLMELHSYRKTPCVYPRWGIHCLFRGYSRGFSGGLRGYSGVFSGYSRPGAFENHWFFHISALDLFGPSDSYIILKRKIRHFMNGNQTRSLFLPPGVGPGPVFQPAAFLEFYPRSVLGSRCSPTAAACAARKVPL